MNYRPLVIIGAGGLGAEFLWIAEEMNTVGRENPKWRPWHILGYVDDAPGKAGELIGERIVHGNVEQVAAKFQGQELYFAVAIGQNVARKKVVRRAEAAGWHAATLIHPSSIIAGDARIGAGTYIAPGCVVFPRSQVGGHVILNVHVSVGHDSVLGDYSQVCPGARISGGCQLGQLAFIGSNGSLSPRISVGAGGVVGANSHAVRNVSPGDTVIGCPALSLYGSACRRVEQENE